MFRLCFVWVYIIKGFCPLIRGKQTLVCEGFAVRGERFAPLLSLQASAGLVLRIFLRLWEIFSRLPEVVLYKGKQNGFLMGFIVVQFFTTMCHPFANTW